MTGAERDAEIELLGRAMEELTLKFFDVAMNPGKLSPAIREFVRRGQARYAAANPPERLVNERPMSDFAAITFNSTMDADLEAVRANDR